jgi:hypothetical protein
MRHLTIGRRLYWILVVALIMLKVGVVVAIMSAPGAYAILRHVDTAIVVVLALVVGGRFADIGWPRWLGITLVLVVAILVPIAIFFASPKIPVRTENPLDVVPDLAWIGTVMQLILLIVAGVKRTSSGLDDEIGGMDAGHDERKEPTFP